MKNKILKIPVTKTEMVAASKQIRKEIEVPFRYLFIDENNNINATLHEMEIFDAMAMSHGMETDEWFAKKLESMGYEGEKPEGIKCVSAGAYKLKQIKGTHASIPVLKKRL